MTAPEFSRLVRLDALGEGPREIAIEADRAECAALAARFGIVRIARLAATAELSCAGEVVRAEGRIAAEVVQACVATGVDLSTAIDEPFTLRFVPERSLAEELELDAGELDEIGYQGGAVDLGEAVAQSLALALDPFPRAPDADARLRAAGVIREGEAGPFSALKGLRDLLG